jgi:hypothetical protein
VGLTPGTYAQSWQRSIASEWFAYPVASPSTKGASMGDEVLCIGLLGVFSISVSDSVIADAAWRLRKAKTLIKLLALAPKRRLHVEEAAELLWAGRDPSSARNNLHQAIFAARRALDSIGLDGSQYLELREELILLSPEDPVQIDAVAFEELAATAREQGEPGAYRSALEGFDAALLPADRYEDWSRERRDSLDELRLALKAELAELERDSEPHRAGTSRRELPSQPTSFVGRERELAEAATLLRNARLLTLTGAGDCGKTRLALQLTGQRAEDFADGVWPVELAALGEPELVGPAIAQALDTRLASDRPPEIALAAHVGDRRLLVRLAGVGSRFWRRAGKRRIVAARRLRTRPGRALGADTPRDAELRGDLACRRLGPERKYVKRIYARDTGKVGRQFAR